jgi:hypothetical protein
MHVQRDGNTCEFEQRGAAPSAIAGGGGCGVYLFHRDERTTKGCVCTRVRRVKLIKNTITKTAHHLSYETQQRIIAEFQRGTKYSRSNERANEKEKN